MSLDVTTEDLRSVKTEKALYAAMFSLLKSLNFRKITIKGICEEALISRATFYAHFIDKYDLLRHWITEILLKHLNYNATYEQIEEIINCQTHENILVLKNIIYDADNETFCVLFDSILSTINLSAGQSNSEGIYPKNIILSNFYAGGILSYLLWQIKNKFPSDVPLMNRYLYKMIHKLQDWQAK